MPKITPFLWYDKEAHEAAEFYVSLFPNSKITNIAHYPAGAREPAGRVMTVSFELDGLPFIALNAGPHFKFNEAVSFQILTRDQAETDRLWTAFTANGGEESMCGWCKDRFGLSWQVTPARLMELNQDPDKAKAGRVMQAMMQMRKIDIAALEEAAQAVPA
jgi:predicted 3-demethylubiquinone-9 3-methyltransferase (glyoxalase superfamily)